MSYLEIALRVSRKVHDGDPRAEGTTGGVEVRREESCWHCHGTMRCNCSTCWRGGPGDCVACKGSGKVFQWIQ